ncbi:MAG: DUF3303 family protein [bacterium]
MRYLVHSEQRPDLTPAEIDRLYAAIADFYKAIPTEVVLETDYVKADQRGSYSVLSVPDRASLDAIMAPFRGLVEVEIVELLAS